MPQSVEFRATLLWAQGAVNGTAFFLTSKGHHEDEDEHSIPQ